MNRPSYQSMVLAVAMFWFGSEPVTAAEPEWLAAELIHLRSGDAREWSSFPDQPQAPELVVEFESTQNADECTLRLRQQDVKQTWQITINDSVLGELIRDENDQVLCLAVAAGVLREGTNVLRVRPLDDSTSDDVRVGEIRLIQQPISEALDEGRVTIHVIDGADGRSLPSRITVVNSDGALHPVSVSPGDDLAVRAGVIYTASGSAEFGLPAGQYTIYAGRGFEYSLAEVEIGIAQGDAAEHTLAIVREVPTEGYVACDTHVHTLTFSGHGDATIEERMVTLAGECVELPVATDHNVHTNFAPYAEAMGLQRYFTPIIGNEVTTPVGHFNAFPILEDAAVPDHEADSWETILRRIYMTPGVEIAVLNHARDLHSGVRPFGPDHFNDAAGLSLDGWPYEMKAMEVVNSGATQSDPLQLFHDWMTLLNAGYRITPIGASDSHDVARHFVGQARTYIRCDDHDPGNIDVDAAVDSLRNGRVMVAYGLLAELTVNDQFTSGDIATLNSDEYQVRVRVLGPKWTDVRSIQLYANGELIEERSIELNADNNLQQGILWQDEFTLPRPTQDQYLVAIAIGPGIEGLYWPTARPYQPASPDWEPYTIGCSGAVWLDADGEPGFSSARDYAVRALSAADGRLDDLVDELTDYDAATATQAAALFHSSGGSLTSAEFRSALAESPVAVQAGFQRYFDAWRATEIARSGRTP